MTNVIFAYLLINLVSAGLLHIWTCIQSEEPPSIKEFIAYVIVMSLIGAPLSMLRLFTLYRQSQRIMKSSGDTKNGF